MNNSSHVLVNPFHSSEVDVARFRCELCYYIHNVRNTTRNLGFFHYHPFQLLVQFDHYLIYYHCAQITSEIICLLFVHNFDSENNDCLVHYHWIFSSMLNFILMDFFLTWKIFQP
jgi:hypothetical protein